MLHRLEGFEQPENREEDQTIPGGEEREEDPVTITQHAEGDHQDGTQENGDAVVPRCFQQDETDQGHGDADDPGVEGMLPPGPTVRERPAITSSE